MNKLTERDLMVGDWVLYNPNVFIEDEYELPKDPYPTKISCGEDIDLAFEDCYSPIPLTAQILERNGFEAFDYFLKIQINTTLIELRPIQGNMIIWLDWDENNDGAFADINLPYPKYLHELQHALRLAGIDKEIEL